MELKTETDWKRKVKNQLVKLRQDSKITVSLWYQLNLFLGYALICFLMTTLHIYRAKDKEI